VNDVVAKILQRGYWRVVIRPNEFVDKTIETLSECKSIIRERSVELRGWDYPHYSMREEPKNGIDYVELATDWQRHVEFWRFYQNAQFYNLVGLWEDWEDQETRFESRATYSPGELLSVLGALYTLTEVYEFAARLASRRLFGARCRISVTLHGTKGRRLEMLEPGRYLRGPYRSNLEAIPRDELFETDELIAQPAEHALDHTVWLFERFNWDHVPRGVLAEDQKKLLDRRL